MFFNSLQYVVFFVGTLIVYWLLTPARYRKYFLIFTGAVFYFVAGQLVRIFLFGLDLVVFFVGRLIFKYENRPKKKKAVFFIGIITVIASLIFFKYTMLLLNITEMIFGTSFIALKIILPLGISFSTFEFIHYLTDIYHGKIKRHPFKDFLVFSFFYPTLISGPIKRFQLFINSYKKLTLQTLFYGAFIVLMGYFYKFVVADTLVPLTDVLQSPVNGNQYSIILSLYAYNFRLFFDFAGYSLIAIGCAILLGYRVPQNFNKPFIASNPSAFWKRWHMSLTTWIRDYVYIFLGGSRKGLPRTILNIMVVMIVFGLWHGAGLNFLVWGFYHGVGLAIYHLTFKRWRLQCKVLKPLGVLFTFHFITFGWVFFATNSLTDSFTAIGKLLLI